MNEKNIQSFSLQKLLDINGFRPEDYYRDGCLIASRVNMAKEVKFDLFRYPARLQAYAAVFCSKGSITFTAGLTRHTISENNLFVYMPGSIIQIESQTDETSVYFLICEEEFIKKINIDIKLLSNLFLEVDKNPCMKLSDKEWQSFQRSFYDIKMEAELKRDDTYSTEIMRSLIHTLAYKICRVTDKYITLRKAAQSSPNSRNEEYFSTFMQILSKHYMQHRSVGFYATQMHLTPKYLTTIIRQTSGRTAIQWIDDYVVLEAKNLLKYSSMSIQEIAYYLNFANQSFFGKYFKNHTGMTPTQYRLEK